MRMHRTIDTVERERVEFRETSFFCDAKKLQNRVILKRMNMCIDKTDYQKTLEKFRFLTFSDNLFFR